VHFANLMDSKPKVHFANVMDFDSGCIKVFKWVKIDV